jgi:nitrogen fixation-related uncharacterized protein
MIEQYFSLNVFVNVAGYVIVGSVLWFGIKKQFDIQNGKDERISKLLLDKESREREETRVWRETYSRKIDCIKGVVDKIEDEMHKRVPFDFCHEKEREMKDELKDHDERLRKVGG